jgi:hypothetical protein
MYRPSPVLTKMPAIIIADVCFDECGKMKGISSVQLKGSRIARKDW